MVLASTVLLAIWQCSYLGKRRYEIVTGKGYKQRTVQLRPV